MAAGVLWFVAASLQSLPPFSSLISPSAFLWALIIGFGAHLDNPGQYISEAST